MSIVLSQRDGAVLTVTLNRPDAFNAFTTAMHAELQLILTTEAADPAIRAVVLTGSGRAFCAGQDIAEIGALDGSLNDLLETSYRPTILALRSLEKPVIAVLNGAVAGAGISLACACDVRIASSSASFVPGFVGLGLVPDAGATWFLPRLIGYGRTLEWLCSNRRIAADEALDWGLVSEVIPAEELPDRLPLLAAAWAERPTRALWLTAQLLENGLATTLDEQLALEARLQDEAAATSDFEEGVAAFREKRPPRFSGS
jgi:2-(1,2-epoxy-1,2-dihydrophenyl)acetyl-CoA isomerase